MTGYADPPFPEEPIAEGHFFLSEDRLQEAASHRGFKISEPGKEPEVKVKYIETKKLYWSAKVRDSL